MQINQTVHGEKITIQWDRPIFRQSIDGKNNIYTGSLLKTSEFPEATHTIPAPSIDQQHVVFYLYDTSEIVRKIHCTVNDIFIMRQLHNLQNQVNIIEKGLIEKTLCVSDAENIQSNIYEIATSLIDHLEPKNNPFDDLYIDVMSIIGVNHYLYACQNYANDICDAIAGYNGKEILDEYQLLKIKDIFGISKKSINIFEAVHMFLKDSTKHIDECYVEHVKDMMNKDFGNPTEGDFEKLKNLKNETLYNIIIQSEKGIYFESITSSCLSKATEQAVLKIYNNKNIRICNNKTYEVLNNTFQKLDDAIQYILENGHEHVRSTPKP